jgi:hypothetical protein
MGTDNFTDLETKEASTMSGEGAATFPLLTFFIGFGVGLLLYPKLIGFPSGTPKDRQN